MFLSINQTLSGYSVIFNYNNQLVQGEVPSNIVPNDLKDFTYQELVDSYFEIWANYIFNNVDSSIKEEIQKNEEVKQLVEEFNNCSLLTFKDGCYYRLNETVSLPKDLVQSYVDNQEDKTKIKGLDSFWFWCSLLPHEQKEMLYTWISKGQFLVTEEGMIVGYKNVVYKETELDKFVGESYPKVKKIWKKDPYKFFINKGEVLSLTKQPTSLNLGQLFKKGKTFTHAFNSESNGQPRLYYVANTETTMNKSKADYSTETCGSGINFMDKEWIESNGVSYMGNGHTVCILVAPNNIVSAPTESGYNKARACAIYTVCEVKWDNGKIVEPDWSIIDTASKEYAKDSKVDLISFVETEMDDENPKFIGLDKSFIKERLIVTI